MGCFRGGVVFPLRADTQVCLAFAVLVSDDYYPFGRCAFPRFRRHWIASLPAFALFLREPCSGMGVLLRIGNGAYQLCRADRRVLGGYAIFALGGSKRFSIGVGIETGLEFVAGERAPKARGLR